MIYYKLRLKKHYCKALYKYILFWLFLSLSVCHCSGHSVFDNINNSEGFKDPKSVENYPGDTEDVLYITFDQVQSRDLNDIWDEVVAYKGKNHFLDLGTWPFNEMNPKTLRWVIHKAKIFNQLLEITVDQIKNLTPEHIREIQQYLPELTLEHFVALLPDQIRSMDNDVTWRFPLEWISALSCDQIVHLSDMTYEQKKVIPVECFPEAGVGRAVIREQVQAVSPKIAEKYGLGVFTLEQMPWITCSQISAVPLNSIVSTDPMKLGALDVEQLKCLPDDAAVEFRARHLRVLSESHEKLQVFKGQTSEVWQILKFQEKGRFFFKLYPPEKMREMEYYIQFLEPEVFQHTPVEHAVRFPSGLLEVLTPARIQNLPYYAKLLRPVTREEHHRTTENTQGVPMGYFNGSSRIITLSKRQLQAIPVDQMMDLSDEVFMYLFPKQVRWFTFPQIEVLEKEKLKALLSPRKVPVFPRRYDVLRGKYIASEEPFSLDAHVQQYQLSGFKLLAVIDTAKKAGRDDWVQGVLQEVVIESYEDCANGNQKDCDRGRYYFEKQIEERKKEIEECESERESFFTSPTYPYSFSDSFIQRTFKRCLKNWLRDPHFQ